MENASAILLCAGFGTRLKPLTDVIPKPAIPFLLKPMVWYAMHALREAGISSIAANVHHLPEIMANTLGICVQDLGLPHPFIYREKDQILGTGGGARMCMDLLPPSDHFIIYHGDVLCGANLTKALESHMESGADVTLVVAPRPKDSKLGMVKIDGQSRVVSIRDWKRPDIDSDSESLIPCCFTGIHIVRSELLRTLPKNQPTCLVTEIYPALLDQCKDIHAHLIQDFFADIGTPHTFFDAQREILDHPEKLPGTQLV